MAKRESFVPLTGSMLDSMMAELRYSSVILALRLVILSIESGGQNPLPYSLRKLARITRLKLSTLIESRDELANSGYIAIDGGLIRLTEKLLTLMQQEGFFKRLFGSPLMNTVAAATVASAAAVRHYILCQPDQEAIRHYLTKKHLPAQTLKRYIIPNFSRSSLPVASILTLIDSYARAIDKGIRKTHAAWWAGAWRNRSREDAHTQTPSRIVKDTPPRKPDPSALDLLAHRLNEGDLVSASELPLETYERMLSIGVIRHEGQMICASPSYFFVVNQHGQEVTLSFVDRNQYIGRSIDTRKGELEHAGTVAQTILHGISAASERTAETVPA